MVCPDCGSCHHESNLIDETPFADAALHAPQLRHFGELEMASEVLTRLATIRIANFLALRWKCDACGVTFDD